jgi:hypothetical protein
MSTSKVVLTGGNFQDTLGNALTDGFLIYVLSGDGQVNGNTELCAGKTVRILLDGTGNVMASPPQSIWPNDAITPNTYYQMCAYSSTGQLVWGPNYGQIISPSPFPVGGIVPGGGIGGSTSGGGSGGDELSGGITIVTSGPYVAGTNGEHTILVDTTGGNVPITLPLIARGTPSPLYLIKKIDVSANTVIITPLSGQSIEGKPSVTLLAQYDYVVVQNDELVTWYIYGGNLPKVIFETLVNYGIVPPVPALFVQGGTLVAIPPITPTLAFDLDNILGNTILVMCCDRSGVITPPTDSIGNTYHLLPVPPGDEQVWAAINIKAGPNTISIDPAGFSRNTQFAIMEYSGLLSNTTKLLDAFGGSGHVVPLGTSSVGSLTTTVGNDLLVLWTVTNNTSPITLGGSTPFTARIGSPISPINGVLWDATASAARAYTDGTITVGIAGNIGGGTWLLAFKAGS